MKAASEAQALEDNSRVNFYRRSQKVGTQLSETWRLYSSSGNCIAGPTSVLLQEDEDDLALARWECRNVEKRLEQALAAFLKAPKTKGCSQPKTLFLASLYFVWFVLLWPAFSDLTSA